MAGAGKQRLRDLGPACWRDPEVLLVTGFGSGLAPKAPGTVGSLAALVIWWWLLAPLAWPWQLAITVTVFALGTWLVHRVAVRHDVGDDPAIVVDEFVGLWIALLAAPVTPLSVGLPVAVAGFLLFRLFDIWKPWPVRVADQRVPGALGVMLDDVLAGLMALAVLQVALLAIG
jgi:phosphatidylglycerophosphatase A